MLEAEVEVAVDDGGAFDGAVGECCGVGEVEEADFGEGEILGGGVDAEERARVVGAGASEEAPVEGGGGGGRGEVPAGDGGGRRGVVLAAEGAVGIGAEERVGERGEAHVGGAELGVIFEDEEEGFGEVEGAVRDGVVELEAGEALAGDVDGEGEIAGGEADVVGGRGLGVSEERARERDEGAEGAKREAGRHPGGPVERVNGGRKSLRE